MERSEENFPQTFMEEFLIETLEMFLKESVEGFLRKTLEKFLENFRTVRTSKIIIALAFFYIRKSVRHLFFYLKS